jgi:hypothetical protein
LITRARPRDRDATPAPARAEPRSRAAGFALPFRIAARRFRRDPLLYLGLATAVGAGAWLIGWTAFAAAKAQEDVVRFRLAEVEPDRRAVQVVYSVPVGQSDAVESKARAFFAAHADVLEPGRRIRIWHRVEDSRLVVADAPERDVIVDEGRLPRPCTAARCEVLALAGHSLGDFVPLGRGVAGRIVGTGRLSNLALPAESEVLRATPDLGRSALLALSISGPLDAATRFTGRSIVTTATLAPDRVHGASLRRLRDELRAGAVRLSRGEALVTVTPPLPILDSLAARADVARERLLLVAGQGALLLVAFAAFAASARRPASALLAEQLTLLAASRRQLLVVRAADVLVPSLAGAAVAFASLVVLGWAASARSGLPDDFRAAALPLPTVAAMFGLALVAAVILGVSLAPSRRASRFGIGPLDVAAAAALGLILWQAIAGGGLSADEIAAGRGGDEPLLVLLPGLVFFASGILLLRAIPYALRIAERVARRGPFAVRLGLLSAIRRPAEIAAATTFLAVSLGACIFALNYRATLRAQGEDEASFRAGAAWRVLEEGAADRGRVRPQGGASASVGDVIPPTAAETPSLTGEGDVTPLTRFRAVSSETPEPALRFVGEVRALGSSGAETEIEVLGFPSHRATELSGWKASFSLLEPEAMARALREREARLAGPSVADDATAMRVWMRAVATALDRFAVLHFLRRADQTFVAVPLGAIPPRGGTLSARMPDRVRGAELVGIEFPPVSAPFNFPDDNGTIEVGRLEQRRGGGWEPLGPLENWTAAEPGIFALGRSGALEYAGGGRLILFHLRATAIPLARPELPDAIPVIASPEVAAQAVDRTINVAAGGEEIGFRIVAVARYFPTVVTHPDRFLVADYATMFAALNGTFPGVATPSEAWFFAPQDAGFSARLARPPFQVTGLVGRDALRERVGNDPLAAGASQVLALTAAAAALMALVGLLLAARASLAAERALSAEYEALGVPPSTIARSSQLRLAAVSLAGILAGFLGGLFAIYLVGSFVAVTASAEEPLPPIRPLVWWLGAGGVTAAVAVVGLGATWLLARRALRESTGGRLRA